MNDKKVKVEIALTPDQMKQKPEIFNSLVQILMDLNYEVLITNDGYCTIIQANSFDSGNCFMWVDEESSVVKNDFIDWQKVEEDEKRHLGE